MGVDTRQFPKILDAVLPSFRANTPFLQNVQRQPYEGAFKTVDAGNGNGQVVYVKKIPRYIAEDGWADSGQTMKVETVPVTISKKKHVDINLSALDLTNVNDAAFVKRTQNFFNPAVETLAGTIESDLNAEWKNISNYTGVAGTLPTTFAGFMQPVTELGRLGVPESEMICMLGPDEIQNYNAYVAGLNNPMMVKQALESKSSNLKGFVGMLGGAKVFKSLYRPIHTAGTANGAYVTNGASQGGNGQITVNTGTGTFKVGDVFTVADCNAWNRATQETTNALKKHVVTTLSAGGAVTLSVAESLIAEAANAYRNVDTLIATGKALVPIAASTTYRVNMVFHPSAFAAAVVPIKELSSNAGAYMKTRTYDNISLTLVVEVDGNSVTENTKLINLYGTATTERDYAIRQHA